MNCKSCQDQFSEFFDEALDAAAAKAVRDHLAMCVECEQEYKLFRKSLGVLHDTGPIETRAGFEAYVVTAATQPIEAVACAGYEQLFSDHYDGVLVAERGRELESHLISCEGCRADYAVFQRSLRALAAKGPVSAPLGFELFARRVPEVPPIRLSRSLPVAVAAAIVVAFGVGYLVQRAGVSGQIDRLVEANKKLRADLEAATKPVEVKDNIARINGNEFPIEEYLRRHMEGIGLVPEGNGWIPKEFKERFAKGESLVNGVWINVADEIKKRADEIAAKMKPPDPPPGLTEEEVLAKHNLVRAGAMYLPRDFFDALQSGRVFTPDGKWREYQELVAEILKERNLVQHDGRWMTEEQRQELLAAQRVKNAGNVQSPAAAALDGLVIGAPQGWKNVTLYPLAAASAQPGGWTTLHDALGAGTAELIDATPLTVKVKNTGAADIVLFAGELLIGGRHARVVAKDGIVGPKKTETVEVFDIEPAANRQGEKFAKESGHYLATPSMRRALVAGQGQGGVWAHSLRVVHAVSPKGASLPDAYRAAADDIAEIRAALMDLAESPDVVGVAVAFGDTMAYAEVFPDRAAFKASFERILRAAALEATARAAQPSKAAGLPNTVAGVKAMIEAAFSVPHETDGAEIRMARDGEVFGRALSVGGAAAHVVVFAGGEPEPAKAAVSVPKAKAQAMLNDYDARVKSGAPAVRAAAFAEMATLPLPEATGRLCNHLKDPNLAVRREVILALGRRGDPAAVDPLLASLDIRDAATFPATVQSLAKLGHVKAVDPLVRILEGKDPDPALAVANALPELLLQIRDREVLERAINRMIAAYEQCVPNEAIAPKGLDQPVPTALRLAIQLTTGRAFPSPVEARMWWNKDGKKFVEDRVK